MRFQNTTAGIIGTILLARGFVGFVFNPEPLLGLLSTSMNHNFMHLLGGGVYIWVANWAPSEKTACGWNKFLGWLYIVIGLMGIMDIGWMSSKDFYGANSIADDLFNFAIGIASLSCGYQFHKVERIGTNFMKAMNWPFGK